jgi:hypothetical protein
MTLQKFIVAIILFPLCVMHNLHSAEIQCTTKGLSETHPLINKNKHAQVICINQIAQLPSELQANILSKLTSKTKDVDELNRQKILSSSLCKGLGIKLFCEAKALCPLKIGNKVFRWQNLIILTNQEQKYLLRMHEMAHHNGSWALPFEKEFVANRLSTDIKEGLIAESSSHDCKCGIQSAEKLLCTAVIMPPATYSLASAFTGCSASATCANPTVHICAWGSCSGFCFLAGLCYLSEYICK